MELAQLIANVGADWADWPVERAVFGATEPAAIAEEVDRFTREELGSSIAKPLFFESSVGSVFGLRLEDGREVVVKGHQPKEPLDHVVAAHTVCGHLAASGFPCPRPLLPPRSLGRSRDCRGVPGETATGQMLTTRASVGRWQSCSRFSLVSVAVWPTFRG